MSDDSLRLVELSRIEKAKFTATNIRGGTITVGEGNDTDFSPVELFLAAIAGCTAIDVDYIAGKRAEPVTFELRSEGDKMRDDDGNHLTNLKVTFNITFPEGEAGDAARAVLPRAIAQSHDRLCTVSRTVQLGTPVEMGVA
ncbi:MAG: OsmC family protein [Aeromicrobium sp.]